VLSPDIDVNTTTPLDFVWLLFPTSLLSLLVVWTNGYAVWKQAQPGQMPDTTWGETTEAEMRAFLGINVMMGIVQLPDSRLYWSSNPLLRREGIARTMTCSRVHNLVQYFHAADRAAKPARGHPAYDRLFKVRPVIDVIGETCCDVYHLSREASIDEAMIAFTGRLSIIQYMLKKPIKRGIKVWVMCDANTAFMSRFEFYLGRQND